MILQTASTSSDLIFWIAGLAVVVFGIYGAILKLTYDRMRVLDHTLLGTNGSDGFIANTESNHTELIKEQRELRRTIHAQGQLLQELVYILSDVTEAMDEEDIHDVDVRRLNYLRDMLREEVDIEWEKTPAGRPESEDDD